MKSQLDHLRKFVAPEFVFGTEASALVGQFSHNLASQKALIVSCPNLLQLDHPQKIIEVLSRFDIQTEIFSELSPNPRIEEVMAGATFFKETECDSIIAIGGGSPIDCAKAIGIVHSNGGHILDYEGVDNVHAPGPPLICIPTTAGTAADISQFCILSNREEKTKISIVSKAMIPDVALIDPLLTMTMPPDLTAYTGIDALTHAIEAYVSNASSPITDLNALEAIRLIKQHLIEAIHSPHNIEARTGMMLASTYAGLAFSNAILGANHALAHSLGGFFDLPHGLCNALLIEHILAANFDAAPEKYKMIGTILGAQIPEDAPKEDVLPQVIEKVRDLKEKAGVTQRLHDLGVRTSDIPQLATNAMRDACMLTNPKDLTIDEVMHIYEKAS